jgi:hypothetical protein
MMWSPTDGVSSNSEHSELRPLWGETLAGSAYDRAVHGRQRSANARERAVLVRLGDTLVYRELPCHVYLLETFC